MQNKEVWKRLIYHREDIGDFYEVSNLGNIRGVKTGKIRKQNINHEGYSFAGVTLGARGKCKCIKVHRAVAETFIPNPSEFPVINHIDGNKQNNTVKNLEWCTARDNVQHAFQNGLCLSSQGERHYNTKLREEDVRYMRNSKRSGKELAKMFNVSESTVCRIKRRQSWKGML